MARAIITSHNPERRPAYEPLYDIDPANRRIPSKCSSADRRVSEVLRRAQGLVLVDLLRGFATAMPAEWTVQLTSYRAYRDAMSGCERLFVKWLNSEQCRDEQDDLHG